MLPMNIAKVSLFFVVLLIAFATSQPYRRSHGTSRRHSGFEWNTRKVGTKKVATISIRKDEERDRRSVALTDGDDSVLNATLDRSFNIYHSHHHHRNHYNTQTVLPLSEERSGEIKPHHYHRHHHGEDGDDDDTAEWLAESLGRGDGRDNGGRGRERVSGQERKISEEEARGEESEFSKEFFPIGGERLESDGIVISPDRFLHLKEADPNVLRLTSGGATGISTLHEILSSVGLDTDSDIFKNVTVRADQRRRNKRGGKKVGKKKKRSKKVKRDRRRRNRGKKRKSRGRRKNKNMKKCKHLRGKQKKKCRADAQARPEETEVLSVNMSGSEACQYHNLEECSRKVGFLRLVTEGLLTVIKCRFREEFFDCMEELRLETCDPNFETRGDMKALRKKIRDAMYTTNSCLISEVVEG